MEVRQFECDRCGTRIEVKGCLAWSDVDIVEYGTKDNKTLMKWQLCRRCSTEWNDIEVEKMTKERDFWKFRHATHLDKHT